MQYSQSHMLQRLNQWRTSISTCHDSWKYYSLGEKDPCSDSFDATDGNFNENIPIFRASINSLASGRRGCNFELIIFEPVWRIDICGNGAVREQEITWTNADQCRCRHMASLGNSELSNHCMFYLWIVLAIDNNKTIARYRVDKKPLTKWKTAAFSYSDPRKILCIEHFTFDDLMQTAESPLLTHWRYCSLAHM